MRIARIVFAVLMLGALAGPLMRCVSFGGWEAPMLLVFLQR
jgi:hypothetical protein